MHIKQKPWSQEVNICKAFSFVQPEHLDSHCEDVAGDAVERVGRDLGDVGVINNFPAVDGEREGGGEVLRSGAAQEEDQISECRQGVPAQLFSE